MPDDDQAVRTGEGGRATRRAVLGTAASAIAGGLAGCTGPTDGSATDATGSAGTVRSDANGGDAPRIEAPERVSFTDPLGVAVRGVSTDPVDVRLSLTDARGVEWSARRTYDDVDGTLDLSVDSPTAPDAETSLLQGATPEYGSTAYYPDEETGDELTVAVERDGETLASATIERAFGDGVERESITDESFVGTLYRPPGEGSAPAVVVAHGSGGRPLDATARLLAGEGYLALSLHYFEWRSDHERLPTDLVEVPIDVVAEAARWLLDRDRTAGSRVGVLGYSKGAELALLAGSRFDEVGAVVSVAGSGYVWEGFARSGAGGLSSWTHEGDPVPFVPFARDDGLWPQAQPRELEPGYTTSFERADESTREAATIPVEDVDGPVLLLSGGADRMWDAERLQARAAERLDDGDHLVYEDAGHAILPPYRPTTNRSENAQYVFGGTVAGHARADADHWPRVLDVFDTLRST